MRLGFRLLGLAPFMTAGAALAADEQLSASAAPGPTDPATPRFVAAEGHHDNCQDNLFAAMAELDLTPPQVPSPLNLFMNIPWTPEGDLAFAAPPRPIPGGFVRLRAEMDIVIAFSACPQAILPINGKAAKPVEAHFSIR